VNTKRNKAPVVTTPPGWRTASEGKINGRRVERGTELSIQGESGRFRFVRFVKTDKGARWIDVIGGRKGCDQWRSFRPERVKTVHVKKQVMTASRAKAIVSEKRAAKRVAE